MKKCLQQLDRKRAARRFLTQQRRGKMSRFWAKQIVAPLRRKGMNTRAARVQRLRKMGLV